MFIQTEETPNPQVVKFLPGRTIADKETYEFNTPEDAKRSPLAAKLLDITGVKGVFYGADFISITKETEQEWFTLKPLVLETLVHYLASHATVEITDTSNTPPLDDELDSISKEIVELIDSRIRPAVAMDGGDIIFNKFENGVVFLKMKGACSGCPSSSITLKSGIENMLRYYIPEVLEVRSE